MATGPRKDIYDPTKSGCFHCYSHTMNDVMFSDEERDALLLRVEMLASIFSIDVANAAVLSNHYHLLLRSCPELIEDWSDAEVIRRYSRLHSKKLALRDELDFSAIEKLLNNKQKIALYRLRLGDISWFMRMLNESVACEYNLRHERENPVWNGRFKMQALLEDKAILTCAVYIDLNLIHAGIAKTIEESFASSIYLRISDVRRYLERLQLLNEEAGNALAEASETDFAESQREVVAVLTEIKLERKYSGWLLPIGRIGEGDDKSPTSSLNGGLLDMTELEYVELVDKIAQVKRPDKPCHQDPDLPPLAERLGFTIKSWKSAIRTELTKLGRVLGSAREVREFSEHQRKNLTGRVRKNAGLFG